MAIKSFGTRTWVGGYAVGSLTSLTLDGREAAIIDVTTHSSANTSREFIGGLITPATLNLEGFFDYTDAGQEEIRNNVGAEKKCVMVFSDGSGFAFDAIIQSDGESAPLDEAVPFTASLQLNKGTLFLFPEVAITGTLNSGSGAVTFADLIFAGIANQKAKYADALTSPDQTLEWDGDEWVLTDVTSGAVWKSSVDSLTPDDATGWAPVGPATGTPTLTGQ